MTPEKECPKCKNPNVVFNGLQKKEEGGYRNLWECLNNECGHTWTTEISNEIKNEFNGNL